MRSRSVWPVSLNSSPFSDENDNSVPGDATSRAWACGWLSAAAGYSAWMTMIVIAMSAGSVDVQVQALEQRHTEVLGLADTLLDIARGNAPRADAIFRRPCLELGIFGGFRECLAQH